MSGAGGGGGRGGRRGPGKVRGGGGGGQQRRRRRLPPPTPAGAGGRLCSAGPSGPPRLRVGRERGGGPSPGAGKIKTPQLSRVCTWALESCFVLPTLFPFSSLAGALVPVPERCRGCCTVPFGEAAPAWFLLLLPAPCRRVCVRGELRKTGPEGVFLPPELLWGRRWC